MQQDSDERYNTMCLKAHQIQALKVNVGSYDVYDVVYNVNRGVRLLAIQLLKNVVTEDTIWIPRQEQIQTLLRKAMPMDRLIDDFDDWVMSAGFNYTEQDLTFDMLWMMYYMERMHGYYWCWSCNLWRLLKYKSIAQDGN